MSEFIEFTESIFYGNSNPEGTGQTDKDMNRLKYQIHLMHEINSALQQPDHSSSIQEAEAARMQRRALIVKKNKLAKSIKTALWI